MKNKKGFTLVEIIVVIAILVVIAGIFSINMIRTMNKNKDEENKNVVTQITSAAEAYVSTNPEEVSKLYEGYGYVDIPVGDLRNAGLLSEDLKDAETGIRIADEELVRVSLQTGDYISTKYPLTEEEKTQKTYSLVAEDMSIKYDKNTSSSTWCSNNDNVYSGMFDKSVYTTSTYAGVTSKLYIMDNAEENKGAIYQENYLEAPVNLEKTACNVNPQVAGTYTINYKFTDPEIGTEKSATRTVYVRTNENDTISFTALINNGRPIALYARNVPITITEKYKDGNTNRITTTIERLPNVQYSIENFSTNTTGYRVAIVKTQKTNSDGSTPSPANAPYTVTDKFLDIINIPSCSGSSFCPLTCNQYSNYVSYNGQRYRVYGKTGNNIHLIYNGSDITSAYGQLGNCTNNSCCNGGRYIYNHLGDNGGTGISATMDDVLNNFYIQKNVNSSKLQSQSTPYGHRKISLLSMSEYTAISQNGSCPNNFLTGSTFWLVDGGKQNVGAIAYNHGNAESYSYGYAVNSSGRILSNVGAYNAKGDFDDENFGTSRVRTDRFTVRPTIVLNNPTFKGGTGSSSDPYIIGGE
ncbi:MAG TPA: hypothetical protein DCY94_00095 [Firmicutes bacterium]|nr:hypothetical protein [Bacillota bacterium]